MLYILINVHEMVWNSIDQKYPPPKKNCNSPALCYIFKRVDIHSLFMFGLIFKLYPIYVYLTDTISSDTNQSPLDCQWKGCTADTFHGQCLFTLSLSGRMPYAEIEAPDQPVHPQ